MKKIITWTPRVFAVIIIIFVALLAFDGFVPLGNPFNRSLSFIISLLPAIILLLALVLAWFYKLAGGITYIILGGAMSFFVHANVDELSFLTLSSPVLAVGVLFLLSHFYEKASSRTQ
jgi:hypothetical protein